MGVTPLARSVKVWLIFVLVSYSFAVPRLFTTGRNIVINSYLLGVARIFGGQNAYLTGGPNADLFKYSPLFAIFFYPLSKVPSPWLSLLWGLLNCGVYWWGMNRFFGLARLSKGWLLAAFIVLSLELNGSLLYQQVNALLIGLSLGGLSYFRDTWPRRIPWTGVTWLSLAANFKILGLSLIAPLFLFAPVPWILASLILVMIPILIWGWSGNALVHQQWLARLVDDTGANGLLDIGTVLKRSGFPAMAATAVVISILILSAPVLIAIVRRLRRERGRTVHLWYAYAAVALSTVLLINPRTESPTFVMASPAFWAVLVIIRSEEFRIRLPKWKNRTFFGLWWLSFAMTSVVFNAVWPQVIFRASLPLKAYGLALLWFIAMFMSLRLLLQREPNLRRELR